jgi:flagellar motor switch protein FliN
MSPIETSKNFQSLLDVEMNITVRFGKTDIPLKEIVQFGVGSMIELNRTVSEPVELLVNNYPFARGEVVVIDGYYGVRVTEIGTPEERTQTLFPTVEPEFEQTPVTPAPAEIVTEQTPEVEE